MCDVGHVYDFPKCLELSRMKCKLLLATIGGLLAIHFPQTHAQITVNSNTSWSATSPPPVGYKQGITIANGAKLSIVGLQGQNQLQINPNATIRIVEGSIIAESTHFKMGKDAKIFLEKPCDAELTVTNCEFFSNNHETWEGIEIGMSGCIVDVQFDLEPTADNSGNCTKAEWAGVLSPTVSKVIANQCKFQNARIALHSNGDIHTNTGGGVIRTRECTFLNCEKGIRIAGWNKASPNASFIMTCDFVWEDDLVFGKSDLAHVALENLGESGVNIGGSHFLNTISGKHPASNRGTGIHAINSDFSISKDGDKCCGERTECPDNCFDAPKTSRRNEFELLGKGIKYQGGNDGKILACRYSDFKNCKKGIDVDDCLDGAVGRNTFTIVKQDIDNFYPSGTSTNPGIIDVHFNKSSGLRIYENTFTANLEYIVGVRLENPDQSQTSFIRRNRFNSTLTLNRLCGPQVRAIDLYGNNNHLDITCNEFIEQVYDLHLDDAATLDDLPDIKVHGNRKYNRNMWSNLPAANNPTIPNFKWKTLGCASNIYSGVNSVTVYDRFYRLGADNMRFEEFSYPQFNPATSPNFTTVGGRCPSSQDDDSDPECVSCNTDCEQLETHKVETGGIRGLDTYQNGFIRIYPNPSNGVFTVALISKQFGDSPKLKIYNAYGQVVHIENLFKRSVSLSKESLNLSSGMYFVKVEGNHIGSTLKLIVQ